MAKLVILKFERGDFLKGFEVTLRIFEEGNSPSQLTEISCQLPPCPELSGLYQQWSSKYRKLGNSWFEKIKTEKPRTYNAQDEHDKIVEQCRQAVTEFEKCFKSWLTEDKTFEIRENLCKELNQGETIRVIIQTEDTQLKKLPWHEWDLFAEHYTKAEIALSGTEFNKPVTPASHKADEAKVRILVILGNSKEIDVNRFKTDLEKLEDAKIECLKEPKTSKISDSLWEQNWDIIIFAGHGSKNEILINSTDSLTIKELKAGLRKAIEHGLQLAIFNSCDGLELAEEFADLNIPQVIFWREPVLNEVAIEFFKFFIDNFSEESLYLAMRHARERIHENFDYKYPGASFLPVIYQNPAVTPPSWENLKKSAPEMIEEGKIFYLHPPERPSYFAGRKEEIDQIHNALLNPVPSIITVIGMGGVGKTTLLHRALEEQHRIEYTKGFWCTAYRGGFNFDMFLDELLSYLSNGEFDKQTMPDLQARIEESLRFLQKMPILLVIDGIEKWLTGWNADILDPQVVQTVKGRTGYHRGLDDFLKAISSLSNGTHFIITSRALPSAMDDLSVRIIPVRSEEEFDLGLEGLEPDASVELLTQLGVKGSEEKLREVANAYANHPLALRILAGIVKKKYGGQLDQLEIVEIMDPQRRLYQLFEEARQNLPERDKAEKFLKVAASCFEDPSIPVLAASIHGNDVRENEQEDVLRELAVILSDWHLLWWRPASQTVVLHSLVKKYFLSIIGEIESQTIHQNLTEWYDKQDIAGNPISLADATPRILAIKHAAKSGQILRGAELFFGPYLPLYSFYDWLGAMGHSFFAIDFLSELLARALRENKVPNESNYINKLKRLIGILFSHRPPKNQDKRLCSQFLLARANCWHQLGYPMSGKDDIFQATQNLRQQYRSFHTKEDQLLLAQALACQGNIVRETGRSSEALANYNEAIRIMEETKIDPLLISEMLVNRANALCDLGALTRAKRDYEAALNRLQRLAIFNTPLIEPLLARTKANLGLVLADLGQFKDALCVLNEADETLSGWFANQPGGLAKPLIQTKISLGEILGKNSQYEDALDYLKQAHALLQNLIDTGRKDIKKLLPLALLNRAKTLNHLKRWDKALEDCNQSIKIIHEFTGQGEIQYMGLLALAKFTRAESLYHLGEKEASAMDREQSLIVCKKVIKDWGSESNIRIIYLQNVRTIIEYLLPLDWEEGRELMVELVAEYEAIMAQGESNEALCLETYRIEEWFEKLAAIRELDESQADSVRKLFEKLKKRNTAKVGRIRY